MSEAAENMSIGHFGRFPKVLFFSGKLSLNVKRVSISLACMPSMQILLLFAHTCMHFVWKQTYNVYRAPATNVRF